MNQFLTFLILVGAAQNALSFSAGVPPLPKVCKSLTPQHGNYTPQISDAPFEITVEPNTVATGDVVTVTLKSTSDIPFKGFYIQGRGEQGTPIGTFRTNKLTDTHSCGGIRWNGAHHANGQVEKDLVMIKWEAPKNYEGEVSFIGSFVQNYVTIWTGVYSDPITVTIKTETKPTRTGGGGISGLFRRANPAGNRTSFLSSVSGLFNRVLERGSKLVSSINFGNKPSS